MWDSRTCSSNAYREIYLYYAFQQLFPAYNSPVEYKTWGFLPWKGRSANNNMRIIGPAAQRYRVQFLFRIVAWFYVFTIFKKTAKVFCTSV